MIDLSEPISWKEVISMSNLKSYKELSLALHTSTGALRYKYKREDLANLFNSYLEITPDLYYPDSDRTSLFIINSLLKFFVQRTQILSISLNLFMARMVHLKPRISHL